MIGIEEIIDRIEEWRGRGLTVEELGEGLTNSNYKVCVEDNCYVVRIPGKVPATFINREVEMHNTISASEIGVGAKVFHIFESEYIIIAEFINGTVMSVDRFKNRDALVRAVQAIKRVNTEGAFVSGGSLACFFEPGR